MITSSVHRLWLIIFCVNFNFMSGNWIIFFAQISAFCGDVRLNGGFSCCFNISFGGFRWSSIILVLFFFAAILFHLLRILLQHFLLFQDCFIHLLFLRFQINLGLLMVQSGRLLFNFDIWAKLNVVNGIGNRAILFQWVQIGLALEKVLGKAAQNHILSGVNLNVLIIFNLCHIVALLLLLLGHDGLWNKSACVVVFFADGEIEFIQSAIYWGSLFDKWGFPSDMQIGNGVVFEALLEIFNGHEKFTLFKLFEFSLLFKNICPWFGVVFAVITCPISMAGLFERGITDLLPWIPNLN